jgi:hypothetical protein
VEKCSVFSMPQWVVYDQLLHASRDFISRVTVMDDTWLTGLSVELCGFDLEQVCALEPTSVKLFQTIVQ